MLKKSHMRFFIKMMAFYLVNCTVFGGDASIEKIKINKTLEEKILHSSLKTNLRTKNGARFIAYLYASDEKTELEEYDSCITYESITSLSRTGQYFLYLYDVEKKYFLPRRTRIFEDFKVTKFNVEGGDFYTLIGSTGKSDVLIITQFGTCRGNTIRAYGFSKDNQYLTTYNFHGKEIHDEFFGKVDLDKKRLVELHAMGIYDTSSHLMDERYLSVSDTYGEVHLRECTSNCTTYLLDY